MLFIDDDQAGVFHRSEQGRAGADDDVGLAIARSQPGFQAFAVVDRRVQQSNARIETLLEARQGLWPQVDFGNEDQRLLAGFEGFANQLQIDFGLAAAGNAGQQIGVEAAEPCLHGIEGRLLFIIERQFRLGQPVFMALNRGMATDFNLHQFLGQQQIEAVLAQHQLAE
ncbi:hypothetical protein D9M71_231240 [compost metagenome]